eukprot:sb/3477912/
MVTNPLRVCAGVGTVLCTTPVRVSQPPAYQERIEEPDSEAAKSAKKAESFMQALDDMEALSIRKWRAIGKPEKQLRKAVHLRHLIKKIALLRGIHLSKKRRSEV